MNNLVSKQMSYYISTPSRRSINNHRNPKATLGRDGGRVHRKTTNVDGLGRYGDQDYLFLFKVLGPGGAARIADLRLRAPRLCLELRPLRPRALGLRTENAV